MSSVLCPACRCELRCATLKALRSGQSQKPNFSFFSFGSCAVGTLLQSSLAARPPASWCRHPLPYRSCTAGHECQYASSELLSAVGSSHGLLRQRCQEQSTAARVCLCLGSAMGIGGWEHEPCLGTDTSLVRFDFTISVCHSACFNVPAR